MQVYLASYHETLVAVKLLVEPAADSADGMSGESHTSSSQANAQALALSARMLEKLQQVWRFDLHQSHGVCTHVAHTRSSYENWMACAVSRSWRSHGYILLCDHTSTLQVLECPALVTGVVRAAGRHAISAPACNQVGRFGAACWWG